jgi:hypothetical protein
MYLKRTMVDVFRWSDLDGDFLMPHKPPFIHHFSVLLCLTLFLALLVSVSASASRFGPERGAGHFDGKGIDLLVDSFRDGHSKQEFAEAALKRVMSIFRQHEDSFARRSGESEQEIERKFGVRWTKVGRILDRFELASDPPTSSVPEPSTAVLMLLGLAGLAGTARRIRVS